MFKTKTAILLTILSIFFVQCKPDKEDYTEGWTGNWKTTDETKFPQVKYLHEGTITKDKGERNKVVVYGTLLGINSSYGIPVKLSSETKGNINYTNGFSISGTAVFNTKDTIWLRMAISQENKTEKDTLVLVKVK